MKRFSVPVLAALIGLAVLAAGCGSKPTRWGIDTPGQANPATSKPEPAKAPQPASGSPAARPQPAAPPGAAPSSLAEEVPFKDAGKVRQAIAAPSPVTYRVVNLGPIGGADKTDVLDAYMAKENLPGKTDLVLMVFSADGHDVRFGMGALLREKGIGVPEMLELVRSLYLPEARKGQPEAGIAALVAKVNEMVK